MGRSPVKEAAREPNLNEEKYRASILGYTKYQKVIKQRIEKSPDKIRQDIQNQKWKGLDTPVKDRNDLKPELKKFGGSE